MPVEKYDKNIIFFGSSQQFFNNGMEMRAKRRRQVHLIWRNNVSLSVIMACLDVAEVHE